MEQFFADLTSALSANNGQVSLQQVTDLLPNHAKHKVMHHLIAARNSGICVYRVKVESGNSNIIITAPQQSGGSN